MQNKHTIAIVSGDIGLWFYWLTLLKKQTFSVVDCKIKLSRAKHSYFYKIKRTNRNFFLLQRAINRVVLQPYAVKLSDYAISKFNYAINLFAYAINLLPYCANRPPCETGLQAVCLQACQFCATFAE